MPNGDAEFISVVALVVSGVFAAHVMAASGKSYSVSGTPSPYQDAQALRARNQWMLEWAAVYFMNIVAMVVGSAIGLSGKWNNAPGSQYWPCAPIALAIGGLTFLYSLWAFNLLSFLSTLFQSQSRRYAPITTRSAQVAHASDDDNAANEVNDDDN